MAQHAAAINENTKELQRGRKYLADYKKESLYDLAVNEYATYISEATKGASYREISPEKMMQTSEARRELAEALDAIEMDSWVEDERGVEIPGTRTSGSLGLGVLVRFADMGAWHARIQAREANSRAEMIANRLKQLSDEGLQTIKDGYIKRHAEMKENVRRRLREK